MKLTARDKAFLATIIAYLSILGLGVAALVIIVRRVIRKLFSRAK